MNQQELQEFWVEFCGFHGEQRGHSGVYYTAWFNSEGVFIGDCLPAIDLNNLFKYAVWKVVNDLADTDLSTVKEAYWKLIGLWLEETEKPDALALYQAIQKARRKDK